MILTYCGPMRQNPQAGMGKAGPDDYKGLAISLRRASVRPVKP